MRTAGATDRTIGLSVQPDPSGFQVRRLRGDGPARELGSAIKTGRLGRSKADKLDSRQVKWLRVVRDMLES